MPRQLAQVRRALPWILQALDLRSHLTPSQIQLLNWKVIEETSTMAKQAPSGALLAQRRTRIVNRIPELNLKDFEAAEELGLSPGQMSRLRAQEDVFTLDRLIDATANIGITVRMTATRPYGHG